MTDQQQSAIGVGLGLTGAVLTVSAAYLLGSGQTTAALYVLGVLTALALGSFGIHARYD